MNNIEIRNNQWLEEKMYELWEEYFNDVPRKNLVLIKFGKSSSRQLGCIKMVNQKTRGVSEIMKRVDIEDHKSASLIIITKFFKPFEVPDEVVYGTIGHEMCHYYHGFNSPLKQLFQHPHKGGIIKKEMYARGMNEIFDFSEDWLKKNWLIHIRKYNKKI